MVFQVLIEPGGERFAVQPGETVLAAAERQGVAMAHECTFGSCGTCRVRVLEGRVRYAEFPPGLAPEEAAERFALACQAEPETDLVLQAARRLPPCSEPARHEATVAAVQPLGSGVLHLQLELPAQAQTMWRPGQHVNVLLPDGSHRSFSMASRPQPGSPRLDFHLRRIPGGRFTDEQAPQLRPGDRLALELPLGEFGFHADDYRPLLMVATGTGLAPLKSMLEALMDDDDCPPVALYWGARTEADLYLHEEIAAWAGRLCEFRYVPVLSRAGAGWNGRRGHVQQAVLEDHEDLSEHAIYLCGSPAMIADAKRAFAARGASLSHVYADGFTFQSAAAPA